MTWTLNYLEPILRDSPNEWRWYAASVIDDIPRGYLASYGTIASVTNERYGLDIVARNIGWLRRYLYEITGRDTTLPLHRIATAGDERSENDREHTRRENEKRRGEEGSLINPTWWNS